MTTTYHLELTVEVDDPAALRAYLREFQLLVEGPGDDAEAVLAVIMHHVNRGLPSDPAPVTVTDGAAGVSPGRFAATAPAPVEEPF